MARSSRRPTCCRTCGSSRPPASAPSACSAARAFAETVLTVIRDNNLDLKVMLGAYPNPVYDLAAEADNLSRTGQVHRPGQPLRHHRGRRQRGQRDHGRVVHPQDRPGGDGRLHQPVRSAIKQPVTTDDNWLFWASVPKVITDVVDFAAVHTYPFLDTFYNPTAWDWRQKSVRRSSARRPWSTPASPKPNCSLARLGRHSTSWAWPACP
jgi:hypothetical protein